MIIKLTVKDNDFNNVMNEFVKRLPIIITSLPSGISNLETKEAIEIIKKINHIDRLLNHNLTDNYTKEDKEIIIEQIKKSFYEFVNNGAKDYAKYLTDNFEVDIISYMEDKWENGEMWYWFQHSGSFLNQ